MTGIQALERIAPGLPMAPGKVERREFEYRRHGTQTLIAAFDQAKAKAGTLAARAGATLGPALTIEESTEAVPIEGAAKAGAPDSSEPAPPAKPGSSTVTATVRVVFALE